METYRLRLEPAAPAATPWQADTLWGHLCWALVRRRGEVVLGEFLNAYRRGEPPLVLSDGFPEGWLPRPLLPPPPAPAGGIAKAAAIAAARHGKAAASSLVPVASFERLRRGEPVEPELDAASRPAERRVTVFRNQIDRLTSTAGGGGAELYAVEELHTGAVEVYVRAANGAIDLLRELLAGLAVEGYGKRRVVGYGAIADWKLEPFDGFEPVPRANAFVSLSRFVPAADDPVDGMWRTTVKFGKVGGETATPFKRPLVALTVGSWFHAPGGVREWYGRLVPDISLAHPWVAQYGLAFALPMRAPAEVRP